MNYVFRCYVEKKPGFNLEARQLFQAIRTRLGVAALANLRVFERFDVDEIDYPVYLNAKTSVFGLSQCDDLHEESLPQQDAGTVFVAVEALPGVQDDRAAACLRSLQALSGGKTPLLAYAKVYALTGALSDEDLNRIKAFLIDPKHSREASMDKPAALTPPAGDVCARECSVPFAVLPTENGVLAYCRDACSSPFQSFHLTGRSDPQSVAHPLDTVRPCGFAQEYYHPTFENAPPDTSIHVCVRENAADLPPAIPFDDAAFSSFDAFPPLIGGETTIKKVEAILHDPNLASQRGLTEGFPMDVDSVLVPYGGKNQNTPAQVSAVLLPAGFAGEEADCSVLSCGFHPYLLEHPAEVRTAAATLDAAAKLVASGCEPKKLHFLPSTGENAPLFAVSTAKAEQVISSEFKAIRHPVYLFSASACDRSSGWQEFHSLSHEGKILAAWAVGAGGIMEGIMKMAFGNDIGFVLDSGASDLDLFAPLYGAIIAECAAPLDCPYARLLGKTAYTPMVELSDCFLPINDLRDIWEGTLEDFYPTKVETISKDSDMIDIFCGERTPLVAAQSIARPKAVIPVFPGVLHAERTAAACLCAGIEPELLPISDLSPAGLTEAGQALSDAIGRSQLLLLPGSSVRSELADGTACLIASFLRTPMLTDAIHTLLKQRDGLALGIGCGFQALVRLGLLPFGEIRPMGGIAPTFTRNLIGRHQSRYVTTRVASLKSPWMLECELDEIHTLPLSSAMGRLTVPANLLKDLVDGGQIATQYVDTAGIPSLDISVNPCGAQESIEGLFSPDGRVFGKLAHSEQWDEYLAKNIPGFKHQPIFEGAARYYR